MTASIDGHEVRRIYDWNFSLYEMGEMQASRGQVLLHVVKLFSIGSTLVKGITSVVVKVHWTRNHEPLIWFFSQAKTPSYRDFSELKLK